MELVEMNLRYLTLFTKCQHIIIMSTNDSDQKQPLYEPKKQPLMEILFHTCNADWKTLRPAVINGWTCIAYCSCKTVRKAETLEFTRHKKLRLIVTYTHPHPKLGWSKCSLLTGTHTTHTDDCSHWDRLSKEENTSFSVNDSKVFIV